MKCKKQVGITLIELMIIVAIIGIIASVMIPLYQDNRGECINPTTFMQMRFPGVEITKIDEIGGSRYDMYYKNGNTFGAIPLVCSCAKCKIYR